MKLPLTLLATVLAVFVVQHQPASDEWDKREAARYLDERMDLWFTGAKKLRTGETQTSCVSCHTVVPYSLARPALRKAMAVDAVTPQEAKILEEVRLRVGTYSSHQLLYDSDPAKETESSGTEAIFNALLLASEDSRQNRNQASPTTRKALERLWETQRQDGAWDWLDFGLEPWETSDTPYYGAALAAIAAGTAPGFSSAAGGDQAMRLQKLRAYLSENYTQQNLHHRTWVLFASTRLDGLLTRAQREALIEELLSQQRDDGGWSLSSLGGWKWSKTSPPFGPPGTTVSSLLEKPDSYATGLIIYVLRQAGVHQDHSAMKRGYAWLKTNQKEIRIGQQTWKAWRAHSLNKDRENGGTAGEEWRRMFMSDAATAFAVLALSSQ